MATAGVASRVSTAAAAVQRTTLEQHRSARGRGCISSKGGAASSGTAMGRGASSMSRGQRGGTSSAASAGIKRHSRGPTSRGGNLRRFLQSRGGGGSLREDSADQTTLSLGLDAAPLGFSADHSLSLSLADEESLCREMTIGKNNLLEQLLETPMKETTLVGKSSEQRDHSMEIALAGNGGDAGAGAAASRKTGDNRLGKDISATAGGAGEKSDDLSASILSTTTVLGGTTTAASAAAEAGQHRSDTAAAPPDSTSSQTKTTSDTRKKRRVQTGLAITRGTTTSTSLFGGPANHNARGATNHNSTGDAGHHLLESGGDPQNFNFRTCGRGVPLGGSVDALEVASRRGSPPAAENYLSGAPQPRG
ncbi:unnamed protein product, partial [Amoebophrya sp. A25]|eukprot:GSA25T00024571001.1